MTAKLERSSAGQRLVIYERRSLELSQDQWRRLERLAERLNVRAIGGPRTGRVSWRSLVRRVAEGELEVRFKK
jgi:hypothetical protein